MYLNYLGEKWYFETVKYVYQHFYPKLVQVLPMSDPQFLALLFSHDLFPGASRQDVLAERIELHSAAHFLNAVIYSEALYDEEDDDFMPLRLLLEVMGLSNYVPLKKIATEIKQNLDDQTVSICDKVTGENKMEKNIAKAIM